MDYTINIDNEKVSKYVVNTFDKNKVSYKLSKNRLGHFNIQLNEENKGAIYVTNKCVYIYSFDEFIELLIKDNKFIENIAFLNRANIYTKIIIEDKDWYLKLIKSKYVKNGKKIDLKTIVMDLEAKYINLSIIGLDKEVIPSYIHSILYSHLKFNHSD